MPNRIQRALRNWAALRAGIPPVLAAYAENERRDRRALEALQVERLKAVLAHADENVPFWRRRLARYGVRPEAVRSMADLRALPPLEERDLRDVGDDLLVGGRPDPAWIAARGLGEERSRVAVWLDGRARRERLADELRHVGWLGLDWRAPRAVLAGRGENGAALPKDGGKLKANLLSGVWLHPSRAEAEGDGFFERALAAKCELLIGPPSALLRLPEIGPEADGVTAFRPRAIVPWGECLGDDRRARIEARLQTPVYEAYRTREFGEIAFECEERNGLHVSMERVAIDFVRDGRTVPDGDDGEMFVTALDNRAMPLLRYRIGDVGLRIPEKTCPCGRTSERILVTDGRASELVTTPAGRRVHGEWFEWLLESVPGVAEWRVVQERPEHVTLEVVRGGGWKEESVAELRKAVAEVDAALALDVRAVDAIYVRTDGRRAHVASRVPLSWDVPQASATPVPPAEPPAPGQVAEPEPAAADAATESASA